MAQIPVISNAILLTGYLGAGKTTLLNRMIAAYGHLRLAVLVNEFGSIGVDGARLGHGDYELIELNRGSLFCICVRTDFIEAVRRIGLEIKPDLLLIEATGIADTTEMERMMALPQVAECMRIRSVVCLVDPLTFGKVSTFLKAPATQVEKADLVVI
ncbi:MAG: GTP-binding protein, partial [bacterium]|nr:GTP-binding protein [bacterium]